MNPKADTASACSATQELAPRRQPMVVLCHLRWAFVFQRPQQLLTRLAKHFDVYVVEEPIQAEGIPRLKVMSPAPGVLVLTPYTSVRAAGFHDDQLAPVSTLLANFLAEREIVDPLVWVYTPMALPFAACLPSRALIYDCMDDLASFKFAPRQLEQRESALLRLADLILTGGPSLYEARKHRHSNIHCLPSAVDGAHFAPESLERGNALHVEALARHVDIARPRIGFFGVIDERFDVSLLASRAAMRPDWSFVMVGPVVKIDSATLPRLANVRWMGMQPYERLP